MALRCRRIFPPEALQPDLAHRLGTLASRVPAAHAVIPLLLAVSPAALGHPRTDIRKRIPHRSDIGVAVPRMIQDA